MRISSQFESDEPIRVKIQTVSKIHKLINDLRRTEFTLSENILTEEYRTDLGDLNNPGHSVLARSMRARLDNLRATIAKLEVELAARCQGLSGAA